jgi:type I restriction enzyme S subunit
MKMQSIKRYEAYKDSGVEWLGEVPAHWEVRRVQDLACKVGDGLHGTPNYVEASKIYFVNGNNLVSGKILITENTKFISEDEYLKHQQRIGNNAILMSINGTIGNLAFYNRELVVLGKSAAYINLKSSIKREYIYYFFQSNGVNNFFETTFAGTTIKNLSLNAIRSAGILRPHAHEQAAIANYLDAKTAQIDRKIDLLSQKAARYGKLKQSLINETVTRGVDKTVPMKDSGVEWIGEMPEHWEVKRVKEISTVFNGATPKSSVAENWNGELPWVTTDDLGKLSTKFITDTKRRITAKGYASCGATICPIGSVVISGRAPIGHIGILSIKASSNQGCKTLVLNHRVVSNLFVFYSLLSSKTKLEALGRGTTFIELSTKELGLFNLPMPPLAEQQAIANYLDEKTAHIDRIVSTINSQIDKLKELRKTLINDVVTGKIKVA